MQDADALSQLLPLIGISPARYGALFFHAFFRQKYLYNCEVSCSKLVACPQHGITDRRNRRVGPLARGDGIQRLPFDVVDKMVSS